jgi:hypothetical protein
MQPMPKPRPAKAPKAFEMQMAKLDPEAVPLPQPKPELEAAPARESIPARRASHRHIRSTRTKAAEPSGLLALFQKLTTPTQPAPPSRRRR